MTIERNIYSTHSVSMGESGVRIALDGSNKETGMHTTNELDLKIPDDLSR